MPPLLRTKLRRKGFDLKELNLAITDCPLDLSRRAPNQVVVTKCKEKFYKDMIAHFSFAPKRCRSIKVFYPLPTKIFLYLYLYLFKNWSHPITTKYLYQPESPCICISSKTGLTQSKSNILFTNQNISLSVSVPLQKPIPPDQSQILWDCTSLYDAKVLPLWTSLKLLETCIPDINNTAVDSLSNCESRTNTKDLILTIQSLRCCKYLLCSNIAMYCDTSLFSELKMPFPHFQFCILIMLCYEG